MPWTAPRLAALCLLLALSGCATQAPAPAAVPAQHPERDWAATGAGLLPPGDAGTPESPESLLHVSDEMRAFAVAVAGDKGGRRSKVRALSQALSSADGLSLQYDAEATLSAEEVFRQRRANCLSFTLLFIALAREVGVDAQFNEVDIPPIWDLGDDSTSLLYRHINSRIDLKDSMTWVVDISDDYDPSFAQTPISDQEAQAQYYNNRSVQLRLRHAPLEALRYEVRALQLAPQTAYLWTNLAELYLQQSQVRAARIAITRSLELDGADVLAYDVAANVYQQSGDRVLAARFRDRAEDFRNANPYYHYQLALAAAHGADYATAHDQLLQAIRLYPTEARFHFLMALVQSGLGNTAEASHSLDTAIALTPSALQQSRYKSKFARLSQHQG